jgi:hypothetical protein
LVRREDRRLDLATSPFAGGPKFFLSKNQNAAMLSSAQNLSNAARVIVGGAAGLRGENDSPSFFRPNPLISPDRAKKSFAKKIWSGERWGADRIAIFRGGMGGCAPARRFPRILQIQGRRDANLPPRASRRPNRRHATRLFSTAP